VSWKVGAVWSIQNYTKLFFVSTFVASCLLIASCSSNNFLKIVRGDKGGNGSLVDCGKHVTSSVRRKNTYIEWDVANKFLFLDKYTDDEWNYMWGDTVPNFSMIGA
jgi:hypothetical protein